MRKYEISKKAKDEFAKDIHLTQGAIFHVANQRFGDPGEPRGIFKYEGGVVVNKREIAIKQEIVTDDWSHAVQPSVEEDSVVEAIEKLAFIVESNGIRALSEYASCNYGDPLRMLVKA